jgi:archaeosine synthase beta-subunit
MNDNQEIERLRPSRNTLNPDIPYHFLHEQEPDNNGVLQSVNTIFLTGKECSFKCVMCDLWKNTLPGPTPPGAILKQIDYALERLPKADVIKLYNSSNFFDPKAVPLADYPGIIERVKPYSRVVVENHPKLCGENCVDFKNQLGGTLEIAMGLESIHPDVLPRLNKQLTAKDFRQAAQFLRGNDIDVRAFILLNPPYLTDERENIEWVIRAVKFAFESGTQCCSIIATRSGNGIMETLQQRGLYTAPSLNSLEEVFETALHLKQGRVFVDTWDIGFLSNCVECFHARKERLEAMNLNQQVYPRINCNCHD